ncbi:hypothetical protein ACXGQW_00155 [Wenyingzhuangia sp. IMCC45533]
MGTLKSISYAIIFAGVNSVAQSTQEAIKKFNEMEIYEEIQKSNLNEEEKEQLFISLVNPIQFFKDLDLNSNAGVIREELKGNKEILSIFSEIDFNKDNAIDEEEFVKYKNAELVTLMSKSQSNLVDVSKTEKIYQAVKRTDKTKEEMNLMFTSLVKPHDFFKTLDSNKDLELCKEEVANYDDFVTNYAYIDENSDEYISEEEFVNYQLLRVNAIIYGEELIQKEKDIHFTNSFDRNYQSVIRIGTNPISNQPFSKNDHLADKNQETEIDKAREEKLMSLK